MNMHLTWDGVDWFGCDDDLTWEPLHGADIPADPTPRAPRAPRTPRAARPLRRLLVLDVENVCPSSRRRTYALARLKAVLAAAGPVDQVVAASAASQHARLDELLAAAGVHVHTKVKNRPDAADRELLQAARRFAREGDCEIVVASNDHAFRTVAKLPGVRRVVLVTVPELATARSLLRAADEHRIVAA
jgi:predicted nuclease of predicted toxin-antitoxin system